MNAIARPLPVDPSPSMTSAPAAAVGAISAEECLALPPADAPADAPAARPVPPELVSGFCAG